MAHKKCRLYFYILHFSFNFYKIYVSLWHISKPLLIMSSLLPQWCWEKLWYIRIGSCDKHINCLLWKQILEKSSKLNSVQVFVFGEKIIKDAQSWLQVQIYYVFWSCFGFRQSCILHKLKSQGHINDLFIKWLKSKCRIK